jgi:hypothetical protein
MVGVGAELARTLAGGDRVRAHPAVIARVLEETAGEVHVAGNGLRRESALRAHGAGEVIGRDPADVALAEVRDRVSVEHAALVLDGRGFALHDVLDVVQVAVAGLLDRHPPLRRGVGEGGA